MEKEFFKELREMTGMHDATIKTMHDVCTYLYWARESKAQLKIQMDDN